MSLTASVDHSRGGQNRLLPLALLVLVGAGLGVAAALQVMTGGLVAALCLVPYLGVLCAVWWFTRGNVLATVLVAYLIAPSPADNLLPQVYIFAGTDYALRERDMIFLADLVLLAALILLRPSLPESWLARAWLGALALLAVYPVVVGLVMGVGQTVPALLQGATMPARGIGVVVLIAWWARTRGWDLALRDLGRTVILSGVVIAVAEVVLLLMAGGELNFSLFNYPLVTDGRPAVPGWGNNILANLFCTCLAVVAFLGHRLQWRLRWRVLSAVLLLIGLAYTEVRIAMMVALVVIETPVVLAVVRRLWPRRGALVALASGLVVGVVLGLTTVTVLSAINPRFSTLLPGFIAQYVTEDGTAVAPSPQVDPETGVDQGGASISTRWALIKAAVDVWQRSPVVGTGWNGWGWAKGEPGAYQQLVAVDPHNGFTWLLADAGVLGLVLLYLAPVILALRRLDLWWLIAVPAVATALEMVNPNLRNGHFAVVVWAVLALAFAATPPARRYTVKNWVLDAWDWIRGRPPRSAAPALGDEPVGSVAARSQAHDRPDLGASVR
jgi:hypothetical protein